MIFGSPFMGGILQKAAVGRASRASVSITRGPVPKTPTLDAFQVVFIEDFCECEDVAFARIYSAATTIRWDEQTSS